MNDQLESKIINLCVAKLRNSPAITCVSRLDLDHFKSQLVSPSFNQSFLRVFQQSQYIAAPQKMEMEVRYRENLPFRITTLEGSYLR
jgi:hypothetical protein